MIGPKTPGGSVEVTTISPNEAPAGVITVCVGAPVNVSVVIPVPSIKVAMLVPEVLNTPAVSNVTDSA
jgi:hypothetical protein